MQVYLREMRKRPILLAATEWKPRLQEDLFIIGRADQVGILKDLKERTENFTMADKIKISNDLGEPTEQPAGAAIEGLIRSMF
jgi:hypothetical protein